MIHHDAKHPSSPNVLLIASFPPFNISSPQIHALIIIIIAIIFLSLLVFVVILIPNSRTYPSSHPSHSISLTELLLITISLFHIYLWAYQTFPSLFPFFPSFFHIIIRIARIFYAKPLNDHVPPSMNEVIFLYFWDPPCLFLNLQLFVLILSILLSILFPPVIQDVRQLFPQTLKLLIMLHLAYLSLSS